MPGAAAPGAAEGANQQACPLGAELRLEASAGAAAVPGGEPAERGEVP